MSASRVRTPVRPVWRLIRPMLSARVVWWDTCIYRRSVCLIVLWGFMGRFWMGSVSARCVMFSVQGAICKGVHVKGVSVGICSTQPTATSPAPVLLATSSQRTTPALLANSPAPRVSPCQQTAPAASKAPCTNPNARPPAPPLTTLTAPKHRTPPANHAPTTVSPASPQPYASRVLPPSTCTTASASPPAPTTSPTKTRSTAHARYAARHARSAPPPRRASPVPPGISMERHALFNATPRRTSTPIFNANNAPRHVLSVIATHSV